MRLPILLLVAACALAQQSQAPSSAAGGATETTPPPRTAPAHSGSCAKDALLAPQFDESTADCILGAIQQGLVTRNSRQVLSVFDKKKFEGYETFPDQLGAMFERYGSIRAAYQIVSVKAEGDHATLLVDFDLEETGFGDQYPPVRKRQQVKFELQRGEKGWKVTDYMPRGFFA